MFLLNEFLTAQLLKQFVFDVLLHGN